MRTSYFCASTYVHRCTSNRVEDESGGVPDHKARRLENVGHGRIVKDTHCRSHRTKATIIGIGEGWVREEYNKTEISSCSGNSFWSQNPKCKKTLPWRGEDAIQVHLRRLRAIKRATFNKKGALYMESQVSNICFKPRGRCMYITTIYIKYMYICSMSKTYESESKTESIEYMLSCIQRGVPPPPPPPRYWRNMSPGTGGTCHP